MMEKKEYLLSRRDILKYAGLSAMALSSLGQFVVAESASAQVQEVFADLSGIEGQGFIAMCYHDVVEKLAESTNDDTMPVLLKQLVDDFEWLKVNGYTVISVADILAAHRGEKELPKRSVFISFDDGYKSFYTYVYPLAKAYKYPVLLAIESKWLETPYTEFVDYGGAPLTRSMFLSWDQVQEMASSEYIDFACHTHDLHRGILANPQGNMLPAVMALQYEHGKGYESEIEYRRRIHNDLSENIRLITEKGGKLPVAMVWPYGEYTEPAVDVAMELGLQMAFSLSYSSDFNDLWNPVDNLRAFRRDLMHESNPVIDLFGNLDKYGESTQRIVHVDLDYIYNPDPAEQEKNLGILLDRLLQLRPSAVYLQAYEDSDGNGTASALYFPNRYLPMKADLFSRVSWQISTRAQTRVYAWMPVMGFDLGDDSMIIKAKPGHEGSVYRRLSLFNPEAREIIRGIYTDLAMHCPFTGILYHDDAVIGDYEDISDYGLEWMKAQGLPADIDAIHTDSGLMHKFTKAKTKALTDFTHELTATIRVWRPMIKTARNIYAEVVLNPDSEAWYAQNYVDFLYNYDYTAIMAMPYMENAKNPDKWLANMVKVAFQHPLGPQKALFELQTVDWRNGKQIPSKVLATQMKNLRLAGVTKFGYYPDDFIMEHPDVDIIKPVFSHKNSRFTQ